MEGAAQREADAAHWVRVYSSLIDTMTSIARDVNGISPRIDEMSERLRYWQRHLDARPAVREREATRTRSR